MLGAFPKSYGISTPLNVCKTLTQAGFTGVYSTKDDFSAVQAVKTTPPKSIAQTKVVQSSPFLGTSVSKGLTGIDNYFRVCSISIGPFPNLFHLLYSVTNLPVSCRVCFTSVTKTKQVRYGQYVKHTQVAFT